MKLPNWVNEKSIRTIALAKYKGNLTAYNAHFYNNGNWAIRATIEVNGKKVSRFISKKDVFSGAVALRSVRAKEVTLKAVGTTSHYVIGDNGEIKYTCTINACSCPDAATNNMDQVLGFQLCKHTIASAKKQGLNSLHDITKAITCNGQFNHANLPIPSTFKV